jgi:hypothetical protein
MTEARMKERFPNQTHVQAGSEHVIWQLSGMARVDENELFSWEFLAILFENIKIFEKI